MIVATLRAVNPVLLTGGGKNRVRLHCEDSGNVAENDGPDPFIR